MFPSSVLLSYCFQCFLDFVFAEYNTTTNDNNDDNDNDYNNYNYNVINNNSTDNNDDDCHMVTQKNALIQKP